MAIVKSLAIPVRITDYSETSVIPVFFTRDFGLVRTIFKGARRKEKAYQSNVDLLVPGELSFYERRTGLSILKKFEAGESFPELRGNLDRYRAATACLEFVRAAVVEGEKAAGLYDLFHEALGACARGRHPWTGVYSFLLAGLAESGFGPQMELCASCGGRDFPPGARARTAFSFEEGGVLCMKCTTGRKVGMWLTSDALRAMGKLSDTGPARAASRELAPSLAREVRGFLRGVCEFTFEQPFRMLK